MRKKTPTIELLLNDLERGHKITSMEAVERYRTVYLTTLISRLRYRGHAIHSLKKSHTGKSYYVYFMARKRREISPEMEEIYELF